jgi:hypothetical protein
MILIRAGLVHRSIRFSPGAQNQSLRYATHQLAYTMGIVANTAHQKGSVKSATRPNPVNVSQKIFFCTISF